MEGTGKPIEFAVKMERFPENALLSRELEIGKIANEEVLQLAATVADFHTRASRSDPDSGLGITELSSRRRSTIFTICDPRSRPDPPEAPSGTPRSTSTWTEQAFQRLQPALEPAPRAWIYSRMSWRPALGKRDPLGGSGHPLTGSSSTKSFAGSTF